MGIKFIVISVQVSHILSYLDGFVKSINQFTCVLIDLEVFYHNVSYKKKNEYKIQVSISHTPEGTNTVCTRLRDEVRSTITKAHVASGEAIALCTTPVDSVGGTR